MSAANNQLVSVTKAKYTFGISLSQQKSLQVYQKKRFGSKGIRTYYLESDVLKLKDDLAGAKVDDSFISKRDLIHNFPKIQENIKNIPEKMDLNLESLVEKDFTLM